MKSTPVYPYILILKIIALIHIFLGLTLPFFAQIESVKQLLVNEMFDGIALSGDAHSQAAYVISLFGPTVASWGILLFVLIQHYAQTPNYRTWLGLVTAIVVWYVGDTSYSLLNNVDTAFVLNTLVVTSLLVPLWRIWQLSHNNKH